MKPKATRQNHRYHQLLDKCLKLLSDTGLNSELLERVPVNGVQPFFEKEEELVHGLFCRFASEMEARLLELPEGQLAERFRVAVMWKFEVVAPYRELLESLLELMGDPENPIGVMSPQSEFIRNRVESFFRALVTGSTDISENQDELARFVYRIHLALMYCWIKDPSTGQKRTLTALSAVEKGISTGVSFFETVVARKLLNSVHRGLDHYFGSSDDPELNERALTILKILFKHRRLESGFPDTTDPHLCDQCFAIHLPKVKYYLRAQRPIHFILPAFPAKSPSRKKTISSLADKAEEIGLRYLDGVLQEIQSVYSPGARITICSDGHVFSDLVGVTDSEVETYNEGIKKMIEDHGFDSISTLNMKNVYSSLSHHDMRLQLLKDYAENLKSIRNGVKQHEHSKALFNGIHRFILEEQADQHEGLSKNQIRNKTKATAYSVIQRSDAWGRLLMDCFPAALRLSIHPQHPHSEKIGILLGKASDNWLTPWHSVALKQKGRWKYVKRHDAEMMGAMLNLGAGGHAYYEI